MTTHKTGTALTRNLRLLSEGNIFRLACYGSIAIVPLIVTISLPQMIGTLREADFFDGVVIGGSLTLSQAKAVDFISSAVLAPLVMAALSYIWFLNARTTIGDQFGGEIAASSLFAMTEASNTASGSYDLCKLCTLCYHGNGRLKVLAATMLFAAIARSTLTNIIAYESFESLVNGPAETTRLLTGIVSTVETISYIRDGMEVWGGAHATYGQGQLLRQGLRSLYNSIASENSMAKLKDGAYILPNITTYSLEATHSSVAVLHNVPATRGFVERRPQIIESIDVSGDGESLQVRGRDKSAITHEWNITDRENLLFETFERMYCNSENSDTDGWANTVNRPDRDGMTMLMGAMGGPYVPSDAWAWSNTLTQQIYSPWGELSPQIVTIATNSTESADNECSPPVYCFMYACAFSSQTGNVDLVRDSTSGKWRSTNGVWNSSIARRRPNIFGLLDGNDALLTTWDMRSAGLKEAVRLGSARCGLDPLANVSCKYEIFSSWDFGVSAHAWLRIEMESSRLIADVAALGSSDPTPEKFVTLDTTKREQRYRMTYIPVLLFVGLGAVMIAAVLVSTITARASRSRTAQEFRVIDSLRLMVDFAVNINTGELISARRWSNDELEQWAKRFMVRYTVRYTGNESFGRPEVVLISAAKNDDAPYDQYHRLEHLRNSNL